MRRALVIALWLTGCFNDHGLAIEIDVGDTGATSVELFVGDKCDKANSDCESVALPQAECALAGAFYVRKGDLSYTVDVRGRTATFRLTAPTETPLPIVIAVGSTASGPTGTAKLLDLTISATRPQIVAATLQRATNLATVKDAVPPPTGDRVMVWSDARNRCLAVERWRDGTTTERIGIGPVDDPTCREGTAATDGAPVCVGEAVAQGWCYVGVPRCKDPGMSVPDPHCESGSVCAPEALCGRKNLDEVRGALKQSAELSRIECTVLVRPGGEVCNGLATVGFLTVPQPQCTSRQKPRLLTVGQLTAPTQTASFGGATLELGNLTPACDLAIVVKGGSAPTPPLDVWGAALLSAQHDFLVPLLVQLRRTVVCPPLPVSCVAMAAADDSMFDCAAAR